MSTAPTALPFTNAVIERLDDTVLVTASGEIDAANAEAFAAYALTHLDPDRSLLIDLTQLDFFGTAGLSALHTINARCASAGIRWAVSVDGAVARVLRICDPSGALPIAGAHSS